MLSRPLVMIMFLLVLVSTGCRPLCVVGPSNDTNLKTLWFGQRVDLVGDYAWVRTQTYPGSRIYIEPVDLSNLTSCIECSDIAIRLDAYYKVEWVRGFSRQIKSLRVVNDIESAELIGSIKIASAKELRAFWKLPVGFIHNNDKFVIWFKVVNKKTGELVFAAQRPDFIANSKDVALEGEYFSKIIDDFDHQKSR